MGHLFNVWEKFYDLKFYAIELNLKSFLFALCAFPACLVVGGFCCCCWGFFFPLKGVFFYIFPVLLAFLMHL